MHKISHFCVFHTEAYNKNGVIRKSHINILIGFPREAESHAVILLQVEGCIETRFSC